MSQTDTDIDVQAFRAAMIESCYSEGPLTRLKCTATWLHLRERIYRGGLPPGWAMLNLR